VVEEAGKIDRVYAPVLEHIYLRVLYWVFDAIISVVCGENSKQVWRNSTKGFEKSAPDNFLSMCFVGKI
jgi:hypothetical protein